MFKKSLWDNFILEFGTNVILYDFYINNYFPVTIITRSKLKYVTNVTNHTNI